MTEILLACVVIVPLVAIALTNVILLSLMP